ncbi:MAG TPA: outer membrane beta-barrel protein [Candidatus Eisenbacteria bacterium]|nr:outer membrane beta-barrel protein [Candidatus Eisenbacteria bacterium]
MTQSTLRRAGIGSVIALAAAVAFTGHAFAQQSQPAQSEAGLGIKGIGVRLGLVDPEDASSALMYGVHVDAGQLVKGVHLIPSVEYWNVGTDLGGYHADVNDLAIRLGVNFDFPLQGQRFTPYLGGAFGYHHVKSETNAPLAPGAADPNFSDDKFGFDVQGGARNQFTPNLSMFGELGYSFVSDASQLRLLGGLTYHFVY